MWFDDVALAIMVHSKAHPLLGDDWDATVSADGELSAAGAAVLGITPAEIRRRPDTVLEGIETAYVQASRRPRTPDICATRRGA